MKYMDINKVAFLNLYKGHEYQHRYFFNKLQFWLKTPNNIYINCSLVKLLQKCIDINLEVSWVFWFIFDIIEINLYKSKVSIEIVWPGCKAKHL